MKTYHATGDLRSDCCAEQLEAVEADFNKTLREMRKNLPWRDKLYERFWSFVLWLFGS